MQRPFCTKKYVVKEFEFEEEDNKTDDNEETPDVSDGTCSCKNYFF